MPDPMDPPDQPRSTQSSYATGTARCLARQSSRSTAAASSQASAGTRQKKPISSSIDWGVMCLRRRSRRHNGFVVPSPPAILTNPGTEDNDEELELPHLEQEETTHPAQSSPSKKQKTGKKKKKPGKNQDSPGSSPRNEPAVHPTSIQTIQSTCRRNPTISFLTFRLHPALEVHREPYDQENCEIKDFRGRGHTTIRKPILFSKHIGHS